MLVDLQNSYLKMTIYKIHISTPTRLMATKLGSH